MLYFFIQQKGQSIVFSPIRRMFTNKESIDKYIYIVLRYVIKPHFNMNKHNAHLLDLPNEILFVILKKLDNNNVLYSFLGINNQRLDIIAQEQIFTNRLNFVSILQSTDEISSLPDSILDRFCISILHRVHQNVISLILESVSMEYILRAGSYPNLSQLELFNFKQAVISRCLMGKILMCTDL